MRFLIIFLVFVNAALLGQLMGWLPTLFEDSADRSRVGLQVAPEMARVISLEAPPPPVPVGTPLSGPTAVNSGPEVSIPAPAAANQTAAPPAEAPIAPGSNKPVVAPVITAPTATGNVPLVNLPATSGAAGPPAAVALACLEVGPVAGSTAQVLQANLQAAPLAITTQYLKQDGRPDDQGSYMVILEGASNQKEAQAREQQARSLGARDAYILPDGPNRFAVSLGIFRAPEAANTLMAGLAGRGLLGMRVISRPSPGKVILKVPNIAPDKVDGVRAVLSGQPVKACTS
jgi:hypothetical protein